jgi:hypothetical protein
VGRYVILIRPGQDVDVEQRADARYLILTAT